MHKEWLLGAPLQVPGNEAMSCLGNMILWQLLTLHSLQIWDRKSLSVTTELVGHTDMVLCLQYDDRVIITGSNDSTIRYSV